jgi:hypothetical protein
MIDNLHNLFSILLFEKLNILSNVHLKIVNIFYEKIV